MNRRSPVLVVGLVAGFLFLGHALINNSHAWPMIWPILAGSAAVAIAARRERLGRFASGIGIAAKTGAVASLLFLVGSVAAVALIDGSETAARLWGVEGQSLFRPAAIVAIGFVALAGVVLAAVAGAFTFPVVRTRTSD